MKYELKVKSWEDILYKIGFDESPDFRGHIRCACPVHHSDNPSSLLVDVNRQQWLCWTNECHKKFGGDIVGFYAGIKDVTRKESYKKLSEIVDSADVLTEEELDIRKELQRVKRVEPFYLDPLPVYDKPPSKYFIDLGLRPDTLSEFHVFESKAKYSKMKDRHCALVLDSTGKSVIGATGRSSWKECEICNNYHNPLQDCYTFPKWKHYGFLTSHYLYNYWNIDDAQSIILVESPKSVWRLYEMGIKNVIATLSKNFTREHAKLLMKKGVTKLNMLYDRDPAGQMGTEQVIKNYSNVFFVENHQDILVENTDPFDMINEIRIKERFAN